MKTMIKLTPAAIFRTRKFAGMSFITTLLAMLMLTGCATNASTPSAMSSSMETTDAKKDIVDTAVAAGDFSTLVVAVQKAGLVETLKGKGPFTVFAPTDEAFAKIPSEKLQALLADKDALTAVLTYHVVPGKVMAKDVVKLSSAKTVQGGNIEIDTSNGVRVDGANVIKTDILTSNGVIHVIDTVMMP